MVRYLLNSLIIVENGEERGTLLIYLLNNHNLFLNVVFHLTPTSPSTPLILRFRGYHDWRSYHRLNIYNVEANKIVQKNNYSVIHSFAVTMPFIDKLCDNAHYGVPEALLPQFQRIIHKVKMS